LIYGGDALFQKRDVALHVLTQNRGRLRQAGSFDMEHLKQVISPYTKVLQLPDEFIGQRSRFRIHELTEVGEHSSRRAIASGAPSESAGELANASRIYNRERQTNSGKNSGHGEFERASSFHDHQFGSHLFQLRGRGSDGFIGEIRSPHFAGRPYRHLDRLRRCIQSNKS